LVALPASADEPFDEPEPDEESPDEEEPEPDFDFSLSWPRGSLPRESVLYQPEPLKAMAGAASTRLAGSPHFSQSCVFGEPKGSRRS
jgi:hypothetical protein